VGETQEEKKDSKVVELEKVESECRKRNSNLSLDSCNKHMRPKKKVGAQKTWTKGREKDSPDPRREKE
jgi:hypothetical protein